MSPVFKCPHCGKLIADRMILAHAGRVGGRKTALRGREYFRKLQSLRKRRRGGRPKKQAT